MKSVYYIKNFPIDKIDVDGREGWVDNPNSLKNRYQFLEAIAEHITNCGYCEPIRLVESDEIISAGPAGVSRLQSVIKILKWKTIPGLLICRNLPEWCEHLDEQPLLMTSKDMIRSFFDREPLRLDFNDIEGYMLYNGAPQPDIAERTMKVSQETKQRMIELFTIERTQDGTLGTRV